MANQARETQDQKTRTAKDQKDPNDQRPKDPNGQRTKTTKEYVKPRPRQNYDMTRQEDDTKTARQQTRQTTNITEPRRNNSTTSIRLRLRL